MVLQRIVRALQNTLHYCVCHGHVACFLGRLGRDIFIRKEELTYRSYWVKFLA